MSQSIEDTMPTTDPLVGVIQGQVRALYDEAAKDAQRIARASFKALLTGTPYKRRTAQGLDAWSEAVGRAQAFGDLLSLVDPSVDRPDFDPVRVRRECEERARVEYRDALTAEMAHSGGSDA